MRPEWGEYTEEECRGPDPHGAVAARGGDADARVHGRLIASGVYSAPRGGGWSVVCLRSRTSPLRSEVESAPQQGKGFLPRLSFGVQDAATRGWDALGKEQFLPSKALLLVQKRGRESWRGKEKRFPPPPAPQLLPCLYFCLPSRVVL